MFRLKRKLNENRKSKRKHRVGWRELLCLQEAINKCPNSKYVFLGNLEMDSCEKRVKKAFPIESLMIDVFQVIIIDFRRGGLEFVLCGLDLIMGHVTNRFISFLLLVMSLNHLAPGPPRGQLVVIVVMISVWHFPAFILFYFIIFWEAQSKGLKSLPTSPLITFYSFPEGIWVL